MILVAIVTVLALYAAWKAPETDFAHLRKQYGESIREALMYSSIVCVFLEDMRFVRRPICGVPETMYHLPME